MKISSTMKRTSLSLTPLLPDPNFTAVPLTIAKETTGSDVLRLLEKMVQRRDTWITA